MLNKIKLVILQLVVEDFINPVWFRLRDWYESKLEKYTK